MKLLTSVAYIFNHRAIPGRKTCWIWLILGSDGLFLHAHDAGTGTRMLRDRSLIRAWGRSFTGGLDVLQPRLQAILLCRNTPFASISC